MTDILGQALQKITSPEPLTQKDAISAPLASLNVKFSEQATAEESSAVVPAKSIEPTRVNHSPVAHQNALQHLLGHRRQAAGIVVAVCIAVFWVDGNSSSVNVHQGDSDSTQADAADVELMLDEFEAIEIPSMREPAEPSEVAAVDPFPLTIPQVESDAAQTQFSSRGSEHPLLNERIDDIRNQSAVLAESNGTLEFPAQPSSDNSPPAIPRSVRFTGRIQPLN